MRVDQIIAEKAFIKVFLSGTSATATAVARVPIIGAKGPAAGYPGRILAKTKGTGNTLTFPRYVGDIDLLTCRFEVTSEGKLTDGVKYVTDFSEDFAPSVPEPAISRPVGTWVTSTPEDMDYLGFGCMMTEINSTWIQTLSPENNAIEHRWNGKTYYFDRKTMELYDNLMMPCIRRGIPCLVRFINRFSYRLRGSDDTLRSVIGHPDYEDTGFNEQMSAFNLRTEAGLDMYCACVDFLCARYANPESPLFCAWVMDVGNEINSQATWHNCGAMTCRDYMEEYALQLRLAYLIGRKYNACHRTHISFDHHFAMRYKPDELRYYPAKECLAYLAAFTQRDGDFFWGISAHPYPENLFRPDFYHDETAQFSFDSPRITMKNLEVWQAVVNLPEFSYRGISRRVIFDEQGFNTDKNDPETENKGAAAFTLMYQKMRNCPQIDQFIINRYADMPLGDESGLCLGLRYEKGYADDEHLFIIPGDYKKVCFAIRDMETDREAERVAESRAYIGETLFDELLSPPAIPYTDDFKNIIATVAES
ncbi:MAG: hypothetical protein E7645_06880 [Ruminococcaceae bacterium]|nr:hypothetical protein [Oscillospiraceae bacterium]